MTRHDAPAPAGIVATVKAAIERDGDASKYGFEVLPESSRTDGEWTYLVIDPRRSNGLRAYEFVSILGRVEAEVRKSARDAKVILLPASGTVTS